MKSILTAPMYLDGLDGMGYSRLERNIKYVLYYRKLKAELNFENFVFIDNASSQENIDLFMSAVGGNDVRIIHFDKHYPRGNHLDYLYCWRALNEINTLIDEGNEKILFIDTDFFILSKRLAKYIHDLDSGWNTLWCPKHNFPESSVQILCKDAYPIFKAFSSVPYYTHNGNTMETYLPFTNVNKSFIVDRYGEIVDNEQNPEYDGYGQANLKTKLLFEA